MNKIYKVIWSKVKHQYVVVSELAHSNGKQSRTSRNSIRSRIAALVVCGAITAFGVYGALPMDSAFAAESYQYIAFKDDGSYGNKKSIEIGPNYYTKYTYSKTSVKNPQTGKTEYYWVRQGYSIKLEENIRFDQDDIQDATTNTVINARKTSDSANDGDLILSYQNVQKDMKMNTLNGEKLNSTSTSIYGGGVNTSTVGVGNNSNYIIQRGDKYVDVGGSTDNLYSNFVRVNDGSGKLTYEDGVYKFNGEEVKTENLYVITNGRNDEVGVFTTTKNGNTLYTGDVYGRNNEILMTGIDDDGNLVSYWGTEVRDNKATVGNMKIETLQGKFDEVDNSIKKIHKDDIKQIQVASATNGGTIGLQTNGEFNEDGTAKGGANVPGTITVTSEGGTNGSGKANDVKIKFASENSGSFTVDAGSKVEGLNSEGTATAGDTLTGIKINGEEYKLGGGKTYSHGQGIAISDDNKISVDNGAGLEFTSTNDNEELKVKANKDKGITVDGSGVAVNAGDGLTFETQEDKDKGKLKVNVGKGLSINDSNQIVNNLEVTKATQNPDDLNKEHSDGGNWTITDNKIGVELTNTTLSSSVTSGNEVNNEKEDDKKVVYGKDYTISDTDGNTATIEDVASAKTLKNVDTRLASTEGSVETINNTLTGAVMYDKDGDIYNKDSVTLGGKEYNKETKQGGTHLTNVAYATGKDGSEAVNVDYLKDNAGELVAGNNNLKVSIDSDNDGNKDNWTITDTQQEGIVFKNTTLDVVKSTSTPIGESGEKYGQNFTIYDTAGNAVKIKDIASAEVLKNVDTRLTSTEGDVGVINGTLAGAVMYDKNGDSYNKESVTLGGKEYNKETKQGGTHLTNVAYATGKDGSEAVNVDYLNDAISDAVEKGGVVSETEKHLATNSGTKPDGNATYAPDADGNITISEVNGDGTATGNSVVISDVASKEQVDKNTSHIGDMNFEGTKHIGDGTDNLTDAIKDLDSAISDMQTGVGAQVEANTVSGGRVDKDGNVILETNKDKNIQTKIKLTDSEVVGGKAENGKLTINKKDNYTGAETSIDIEGVATTDMIGAKDKEDLASKYKDADKDGNATTEYITESESMVEADVALDHAIQDVANTSYANDMVLSNRIDSVEKRLGNVEERIDKVGAMAAAIANLRTMGFDPEAPTEIAIGVGQYKSETGLALGIFHYPNQDFMLSASLSSSGDELMGGIGATWKLGRKSAAERAKDEEARHLEQAEEMKKLAQQEKVKAQAQRHAKLLAERQQASQKNA